MRNTLAVLAITFAELYVTVHAVPDAIGAPATIGLLVASSMLGVWLLKQQGRVVWRRFTAAVSEGRVPNQELVDGVLVIFGGALLIVPGFITDVIGLLLLIPATRPVGRRLVQRSLRRRGLGAARTARTARTTDFDVEGTATTAYPPPAETRVRTPGRELRP